MSKRILNKRRHLTVTASSAIMATAMLAAPSHAQSFITPGAAPSIVTDTNLDTVIEAHIVGGDLEAQVNTGNIDGDASTNATITNDGAATGTFENNENSADAEAFGNRDGVGASLATIGSSAQPDDGIALSSVSVNEDDGEGFGGAITAHADNSNIGFIATDFTSGSVDVSGNSVTATAVINLGSGDFDMAITGAEPTGYTGIATENAEVVTDLYNDLTNYAQLSGTLLISSVQEATSSNDSEARADDNLIEIDIDRTGDADVTGSLTLDNNTIAADYTGNDRAASIGIAADDANSAVTAAISNVQYLDAHGNVGEDAAATVVQNNIEGRVWTDNFDFDTTALVNGSLSVSGNDTSASATGNRAATDITLADGLAYNTSAGNYTTAVIDEYTDGEGLGGDRIADVQVTAGLVGANNQLVEDGVVDAYNGFNTTESSVQSLESSSIDMTGNRMLAAATGNTLDAAITSGEASATFDASAALVSRQELINVLVDAQVLESDIEAQAGSGEDEATFVDSEVTLDLNVIAASATGNKASQDITLSATDLRLGAGEDGVYLEGDLTAGDNDQNVYGNGSVLIANAQFNSDSDVDATNIDSDLRIDADDWWDGTSQNTQTAITDNVQQAYAAGSDAGNSLTLNGVDVGTGAGITNVQGNDSLSDVSALLRAEAEISYSYNDLLEASATIADNEQSAVAKGAIAANTLVVNAQTIDTGNIGGNNMAHTDLFSLRNVVDAAYGVANTQGIAGDVTATATGDNDDAFEIDVDDDLRRSTATVVDNSLLAQAQGVVANNAATLNVGTLNSFFGEDDVAVSNLQVVDGSDIFARATGEDDHVARVDIGGDVDESEVENSRNDVIAVAESARATNSLTIDATSINTFFGEDTGYSDAYLDDDDNYVDAMFGVVNTQLGANGTVTATLRDGDNNGNFYDSATIYTDISVDVIDSSVASDGNLLQALAAGNRAFNEVEVASVTTENVNAGLSNLQANGQDVTSLIGYAGMAGTDGTPPFTVDGTVTTGVWNGNISGLTADEKTAFVNQYSGQGGWTYNEGTGDVSFTSVGNGFLQLTVNGTDPTEGTRLAGGVLVEVFNDVYSSSITVDGNNVQGSALGNAANNSVSVDVTSLDGRDGFAEGRSWTSRTGSPEAEAAADYTLASSQVLLTGSSSTTDVVNLFGIDVQTDNEVFDSELSVSNNTQFAEAIGNTVVNSLDVSGTDLTNDNTSGSLVNSQDGVATVDANSEMEVFANAVSSSSNIAMDGNRNTALAVVNNATNTLTSETTNSGGSSQAYGNSWADNGANVYAEGSFVLANAQNSGGTLNSDATTTVYNVERYDSTTTGLTSGTVSQSSNATRAEATANRSANTMTLDAGANLGSTGALVNQQNSSTTVNANATSNITLGLNGTVNVNEAVDGSSISIENNTTLALARGNSASNTLNYTAGANYTANADHAYTDPQDVYGNAAVLNDQVNTGAVNATATGSTQVALNGLNSGAGGSVLNSSVTNSNNSVAAYAYGNSASNTVMLSALNTGTANAAIGNQQLNTGAVTATATSVSFNMSSVGTVGGASMQNNGNAASAVAVGNSSVSFIGAQ